VVPAGLAAVSANWAAPAARPTSPLDPPVWLTVVRPWVGCQLVPVNCASSKMAFLIWPPTAVTSAEMSGSRS